MDVHCVLLFIDTEQRVLILFWFGCYRCYLHVAFLFCETRSHTVTLAGLGLEVILLSLPPETWDWCELPSPALPHMFEN